MNFIDEIDKVAVAKSKGIANTSAYRLIKEPRVERGHLRGL